jgi:hypothetical protein
LPFYVALKPPSTINSVPVINDDSSEARKTAAFAISIGSASFLIGIC